MTVTDGTPPAVADVLTMPSAGAESLAPAERIVGFGFRCWLLGYQTGSIADWEACWSYYRDQLGVRDARAAMADLSSWVGTVRTHSIRAIDVFPAQCRQFCRDECLAVSLIAASQHRCPALTACAVALTGAARVDSVLRTAGGFALTLDMIGVRLGDDMVASQRPPMAARH